MDLRIASRVAELQGLVDLGGIIVRSLMSAPDKEAAPP